MRPANGISETAFRRGRLMSWIEWFDIVAPNEGDWVHDLRCLIHRFALLFDCGRIRSDVV
jgi:hypothetical protein